VKFKTSRGELSKPQRLTHLGITEATKMTPTAAVEAPLRFPPLYLEMEAEAQPGVHRLCCNERRKPRSEGYGHADMSQSMMEEPILQIGIESTCISYAIHDQIS
jgi:hypothetical protein